ncbi:MAG: hypothetical protein R3D55_07975 [Chloroflexota bacterium]
MSEQAEIERILASVRQVADVADVIIRIVERMAELDLIFARARYAALIKAYRQTLWIGANLSSPGRPNTPTNWPMDAPTARNPPPPAAPSGFPQRPPPHCCHPAMSSPTDLTLGDDIFAVLITGPNTGGKTVSLKTTGLMVLMAQSGLHLPAIEARLTVFEDVFADIDEAIHRAKPLHAYSAHMTQHHSHWNTWMIARWCC